METLIVHWPKTEGQRGVYLNAEGPIANVYFSCRSKEIMPIGLLLNVRTRSWFQIVHERLNGDYFKFRVDFLLEHPFDCH